MRIVVNELRYARLAQPTERWPCEPYVHQIQTLTEVRQALQERRTVCIENTSMTGSGKTLANFAAAILDGVLTIGVYPTNELIMDQDISLHSHFPRGEKRIIDRLGLDSIQEVGGHQSRAAALDWVTGDHPCTALLTNPDILYLVLSNLYGQMIGTFQKSQGSLAFQNVFNNYPVIVFDEFHLYTPKQIAHAAFIMGLARELVPDKPHIFIFSSATPQPLFKQYAKRLGIEVRQVSSPLVERGRVVCEPLNLTILPGDLQRWQGGETIRDHLNEIRQWADSQKPAAKGVFIVDSVYDARMLADLLRQHYPASDVGEVHGFLDEQERDRALRCRFSVGTTTIDVGVDLVGDKTKDFLVCEARSSAQAIQRIGRLGRRGREPDEIVTPNTIWLVVPDYVHEYIQKRIQPEKGAIARSVLTESLHMAYLPFEDFGAYTCKYAPLEVVAACERIKQQYQTDVKSANMERLQRLLATLHRPDLPETQEQAAQFYQRHRRVQWVVWQKFGTPLRGDDKKYYLGDLESFRGGFESEFEVAIYDERDAELGMKPLKCYNLFFTLRRTMYQEMLKDAFAELLHKRHPHEADGWLATLAKEHPGLLGYIHVHGLIEGKARRVYCELPKVFLDEETYRMPVRLPQGKLAIGGENLKLLNRGGINEELGKRALNCWITPRTTFVVSQGQQRPLPALFTIYPLVPVAPFKALKQEWSIAFGVNAFLLESIFTRSWWARKRRGEDGAIFC